MRLLEKLGQQVWLYGQKNNVGCADGFDIIAHLNVYECRCFGCHFLDLLPDRVRSLLAPVYKTLLVEREWIT